MGTQVEHILTTASSTVQEYIYAKCKIKELEAVGHITAVFITKRGVEYQVRYYIEGEQREQYFFDFEISIGV